MADVEPINVSALNQYTYCPRRCGLIYLESEFSDNIHTARGQTVPSLSFDTQQRRELRYLARQARVVSGVHYL